MDFTPFMTAPEPCFLKCYTPESLNHESVTVPVMQKLLNQSLRCCLG